MAIAVISRSEAKAKGLKRYFTGKPCKHGHVAERITANGVCTGCTIAIETRYRDSHREKVREKWRNFERNASAGRQERRRIARDKWEAANPEKCLEIRKRCREKKPDLYKAKDKRWRDANRPHIKIKNKTYKSAHAERLAPIARQRARQWQKDNPDKVRVNIQRRRARKAEAEGSHTADELKALLEGQNWRCNGCGCCLKLKKNRAIDHKEPLSRGGSNYASNLQWLCKPCNSSKHDKPYEVWLAEIRLKQENHMSFDSEQHYIDGAGFQRHKETHHLVGIEGKPHQRVAEDEEWPKWVKPHPNHIKRQATLGGAPHTSTPGFECFVNDREGGEVTVKVHDEEEEKRALADPHAKAVDTESDSAYGG